MESKIKSAAETALMMRSRIAAQIGLFEMAIEDANQVVRTSEAQVPVLAHRCRILALANRELEQARRDCNEARRLDGRYSENFAGLGLISFREGDPSQAIEHLSRALGGGEGADLLYVRGLAHAQVGNSERARADIDAAIEAAPNIEQVMAAYGFVASGGEAAAEAGEN